MICSDGPLKSSPRHAVRASLTGRMPVLIGDATSDSDSGCVLMFIRVEFNYISVNVCIL